MEKDTDNDRKQLLEQLAALHRELRDARDLDKPVMEALLQIAGDIRGLVEKSGDAPAATDLEKHSFLSEQVEKFETNHPVATRFLAQLTDLLGSIGI